MSLVQRAEMNKELSKLDYKDVGNWEMKAYEPGKNFLQKNGIDCAIWVICYADCFARGKPCNMTQKDISETLRLHVAADLIRGGLSCASRPGNKRFFESGPSKQNVKKKKV